MSGFGIKEWLTVAQLLVLASSVGINLFLFIASRRDARWKTLDARLDTEKAAVASDMARINHHVTDFDRRLSVLAAEMKSMPTHRDLQDMHEQLARIDERSETTAAGVARIEKYLLERAR